MILSRFIWKTTKSGIFYQYHFLNFWSLHSQKIQSKTVRKDIYPKWSYGLSKFAISPVYNCTRKFQAPISRNWPDCHLVGFRVSRLIYCQIAQMRNMEQGTVRSGAEERTFWGARLDVLIFRLCSYHVLISYSAECNGPKFYKTLMFLGQAGMFLSVQARRSSATRSSTSDLTGITIGLKPNFETWRAIFKRFFFLSESLSKMKCLSIFLERLYHFKVPKKVKIGEKWPKLYRL